MKVKFDYDKIVIYLKNTSTIEDKQIKNILFKLKERYQLSLNGYFEIKVFNDVNYGIILEVEKLDADYYEYISQVDFDIIQNEKNEFLYEVNYNHLIHHKNIQIIQNKDKLYLKIKNKIPNSLYYKLLEYSNIIYGEKLESIMKYSKRS